jgi:TolB-like protein
MVAAWPGTVVEDNNLTVQISTLRRILDQNRQQGSCIQTVPGRGYRFVAPVTRVEPAASPAPVLSTGNGSDGLMAENEQAQGPGLLRQIGGIAPTPRPRGRHPLWGGVMATVIGAVVLVAAVATVLNWRSLWPRNALQAPRLSIVVLPFANLGNDPEQQYFADGVTEDLTIDLSRIAHMFVISRNTAFTYRNKQVDTKQIGRELGVRYVLEGSVRRSGDQLRVTAELIDAETDAHLWAERFDRETGDLFALQSEITRQIARALNLELIGAEAARPTERPDALDYILRGRAAYWQAPSRENYAAAAGLFERALTLDPSSAEAQSLLASALVDRVMNFPTQTDDGDIKRAEELAIQAVRISPRSALAHFARGQALRVQRRCDKAIPEYETALALNRNWSGLLADIGRCKIFVGPIEEAIPLQEQAIRLSPRDPLIGIWYYRIGQAHLLLSRIDEAILWFDKARGATHQGAAGVLRKLRVHCRLRDLERVLHCKSREHEHPVELLGEADRGAIGNGKRHSDNYVYMFDERLGECVGIASIEDHERDPMRERMNYIDEILAAHAPSVTAIGLHEQRAVVTPVSTEVKHQWR